MDWYDDGTAPKSKTQTWNEWENEPPKYIIENDYIFDKKKSVFYVEKKKEGDYWHYWVNIKLNYRPHSKYGNEREFSKHYHFYHWKSQTIFCAPLNKQQPKNKKDQASKKMETTKELLNRSYANQKQHQKQKKNYKKNLKIEI